MISIKQALRSGWILGIGLTALIVIAFATRSRWWEPSQNWVRTTISCNRKVSSLDSHDHGLAGGHDSHAHEGHDHGDDDGNSLQLSAQAQGNIGLTPEGIHGWPATLWESVGSNTVPAAVSLRIF